MADVFLTEENLNRMPFSLEAEQSVLGAIIIDPEKIRDVANSISADDFYLEQHKAIYEAMRELYLSNNTIDVVTLIDELVKTGTYDDAGGKNYVAILAQSVPSIANLPDYLRMLQKAKGSKMTRLLYPKTTVSSNRALQFIGTDGSIYSCSAGKSLITVDEFGQVMPCRRMPIICGKLPYDRLEDIYFEHEVFAALRGKNIPQSCRGCSYRDRCGGGARCQAYAVNGSFFTADPACSLVQTNK